MIIKIDFNFVWIFLCVSTFSVQSYLPPFLAGAATPKCTVSGGGELEVFGRERGFKSPYPSISLLLMGLLGPAPALYLAQVQRERGGGKAQKRGDGIWQDSLQPDPPLPQLPHSVPPSLPLLLPYLLQWVQGSLPIGREHYRFLWQYSQNGH